MLSPPGVRSKGALLKPGEVSDTIKYGCRTKLLMSPAMGSRLTGCEVVYHKPGETFTVRLHPISEVVIEVFKGKGEVFLGEFWYEVNEGDVIYAPENVKHGTRNPSSNSEEFICYYWQAPYLDEFDTLPGARFELFEGQGGPVIACNVRGKFDARIPYTGYIGNVNSGALFMEHGAPMRFVVWPGMGARKITLHRAFHPAGVEFKPHIHPTAEDTILAFRGRGQGFLVDRWYDMEEGDVLFAPYPVKHGTRNSAEGSEEPFICTGAAAPPQIDLYRLAGYL